MNFLVDAQLPRRLARYLLSQGHDALHTLDLPEANRTPDRSILHVAARDGRVVVTKDSDFVDSFILAGEPEKLLLISTGNISNVELDEIITANLERIVTALSSSSFVELTRTSLIVHS